MFRTYVCILLSMPGKSLSPSLYLSQLNLSLSILLSISGESLSTSFFLSQVNISLYFYLSQVNLFIFFLLYIVLFHIEEKARVVAALWGTEFIQFLAGLAILHDHKEQDEFIIFFKSSWCNSSISSIHPSAKQLARQGIVCPPNSSDDLCLFFYVKSNKPSIVFID